MGTLPGQYLRPGLVCTKPVLSDEKGANPPGRLLNATKSFCLCDFMRPRLSPAVHFSVCSPPAESRWGRHARLAHLRVAPLCDFHRRGQELRAPRRTSRPRYLTVALIGICTNIYMILIVLSCVVATCKAVRFPGLLSGVGILFNLAFPPQNPVSPRFRLIQHKSCTGKHHITSFVPSLTSETARRGGRSGTQRGGCASQSVSRCPCASHMRPARCCD